MLVCFQLITGWYRTSHFRVSPGETVLNFELILTLYTFHWRTSTQPPECAKWLNKSSDITRNISFVSWWGPTSSQRSSYNVESVCNCYKWLQLWRTVGRKAYLIQIACQHRCVTTLCYWRKCTGQRNNAVLRIIAWKLSYCFIEHPYWKQYWLTTCHHVTMHHLNNALLLEWENEQ
jgi:hypothetical protein